MIVTAIRRGFFGGEMKKVGDKFDCPTEAEFSKNWMKKGEAKVKKIDNSNVKSTLDVKHEPLEIPSLLKKEKKTEKKTTKKKIVKAH